ncbi:MAG TPA: hypothetical protein VHX63_10860 [Acidobacteriaceae bacterium]|jgi:hypothetical protein|nr:hypothetical protein [Acidobacteriaceae bacterium]
MQNAQNTFYITLRNRLATLNPNRTIFLRGVTRPGILVESNELVLAEPYSNVFILRWLGLHCDPYLPEVLQQMECEIEYLTEGTTTNLGMDRGQMMAEMDAELAALLSPNSATKLNYAQSPPTEMETQVFWTEATFQPVKVVRDRLSRTVTVSLFSYQEPGEL